MANDEDRTPGAATGGAWASIARISLALLLACAGFASWLMWSMTHPPVSHGAQLRTMAWAEASEIGKAVGFYRALTGRMPASLADLCDPLPENGGETLVEFGDDPWGHPYEYDLDGPLTATITCHGADGAPGGEGDDEDIVLRFPYPKDRTPR